MKTCNRCNEVKSENDFNKKADAKDGLVGHCRACHKIKQAKYYIENKESIDRKNKAGHLRNPLASSLRAKRYYLEHREVVLGNVHAYYSKNKKRIHAATAKRYREDPLFRLSMLIRNRIKDALNGNYKTGSAVSDLGCTIEEFKVYIEKQFKNEMTWDNQGGEDGWQLDHIRPLASFDLMNRGEFLKAVHYTNYQPLSKDENLRKNSLWNGSMIRGGTVIIKVDSALAS